MNFGFGDLLWLFFLLMAVQPMIEQRMLEYSRQRLIAQIERKRRSRVIVLIHRQETMGFFGFPIVRYIDINDSEEVLRAIRLTDPEVPIDLIVHTPGGLALAALQIARAIKDHPGQVTVFVPHYAMSGGTLIALAADRIIMSEHAVLGPVDPQLGHYPAVSLLSVLKKKPIEQIEDETLILADQAEKAIRQVRESVRKLLTGTLPPEQADQVAQMLSEGRWTHDHPITVQDLKEMGLPVSTEMPVEVMQLMRFYRQPVRHRPTVDYLPVPRRREGSPRLGEGR
ncbi:MAG: hypothetical protein KatS3mg115_1506 [Candidatus Poribacteria bacterium]|nr:MAG: hypothetical protein KatS3mg115_1506 [Candidatus Poribacteria bacterium]